MCKVMFVNCYLRHSVVNPPFPPSPPQIKFPHPQINWEQAGILKEQLDILGHNFVILCIIPA